MVQSGAGEITTSADPWLVDVATSYPRSLTPQTAQSPEETPQKCAVGRDVLQIVESPQVKPVRWSPARNFLRFALVARASIAWTQVSNSETATDCIQPTISKRLDLLLLQNFWGWTELSTKRDRRDIFP